MGGGEGRGQAVASEGRGQAVASAACKSDGSKRKRADGAGESRGTRTMRMRQTQSTPRKSRRRSTSSGACSRWTWSSSTSSPSFAPTSRSVPPLGQSFGPACLSCFLCQRVRACTRNGVWTGVRSGDGGAGPAAVHDHLDQQACLLRRGHARGSIARTHHGAQAQADGAHQHTQVWFRSPLLLFALLLSCSLPPTHPRHERHMWRAACGVWRVACGMRRRVVGRARRVTGTGTRTHAAPLDGEVMSSSIVDFYLEKGVVHIADSRQAPTFVHYFTKHISKLQTLVSDLNVRPA